MTRATRIALGETGFERAAVWSAVGFALSYAAFDAAAIAGLPAASPALAAPTDPIAGALATLAVVGVVAFAATGGGLLPVILLAYGPFVAVLLRTIGPAPYTIAFADPVPFAIGLVGPLGLALAAAVAAGILGYALGRLVAGIGSDGSDGSDDDEVADSDPGSRSDASAADD